MPIRNRISTAIRSFARRTGSRLVSFGSTPPAVRGVGRLAEPYRLPRDLQQEAILKSKEALYGRTSYFLGPVQNYISTYPGTNMNPARVSAIHQEVLISGYMLNKACLDEDIFLRDSHLKGVDEARRVASVGKPLFIKPINGSDLARKIADYLQAVVDDIDNFDASMKELLYANAAGYAVEEVVYKDKPISFPVGKNQIITVNAIHPQQLDWVSNKHTRFDVATDELELDMGNGKMASLPAHKFITHITPGDLQKRRRGYMYQAVWLHMIKHEAIARWATVLDIWGIPVPYGVADEVLWQDEHRKREMYEMMQNYGLGKPAIFTSDFEVKPSPTVSVGDARGMHAALIGWANTEMSKLIQGETLTTELGGVGSYNASETHAATKESIVAMDAKALSHTIRYWLRSVLELNMDKLTSVFNASPEDILRLTGRPYWRIDREVSPMQRMQMFDNAVNNLGLEIDEDQAYEEFGLTKARDPMKRISGKAVQVNAGASLVEATAANEGLHVRSPQEIQDDLAEDTSDAKTENPLTTKQL